TARVVASSVTSTLPLLRARSTMVCCRSGAYMVFVLACVLICLVIALFVWSVKSHRALPCASDGDVGNATHACGSRRRHTLRGAAQERGRVRSRRARPPRSSSANTSGRLLYGCRCGPTCACRRE